MSLLQQPFNLERTIRRWDFRRRQVLTLIWLPRGVLAGTLVGILLAVISRLTPWLLRDEIIQFTTIAIGITTVLSALFVWLMPRSLAWLVKYFDLQFHLKERLSTAYELTTGKIPAAENLRDYQWSDTQAAAKNLNLGDALPFELKWRELFFVILMIGTLGFLVRDEVPFADDILEAEALAEDIETQIEELENIREDIVNDESLSDAQRQELLEPLDEALEALQEPAISREEVLAALSEAQEELERLGEGFTPEEEVAFEEAGDLLSEAEAGEEAGDALSEGSLDLSADALEELAEQIANDELSPEELAELAEQLEEASNALENVNPQASDGLESAAEGIEQNESAAAQEGLQEAADALREQQENAQNSPESQAAQEAAQSLEQSQQDVAESQQNPSQAQPQQGDPQQAQPQDSEQNQRGQPQDQNADEQSQQQQQQQGQPQQGDQQQQGQQDDQQGDASQALQGQQGQIGVPQQGQQNQAGQQQSQQGNNVTGAGETPGDQGEDVTEGQQSNQQVETNNATGDNDSQLNPFDSVFAPSRIGEDGSSTDMSLQGNPSNDEIVTEQEGSFNEQFNSDSSVAYEDVFADYSDSVNEALNSDYIPIGLRDVIREYFSSLEP